MKLIQRVAYYGAGFIVGLIILFFFLGGKKASCDYGFDARTLKNIRSKKIVFSDESLPMKNELKLDTVAIHSILEHGDVDFSETDRNLDSCKIYLVDGLLKEQLIRLRIENCNEKATVLAINKAN